MTAIRERIFGAIVAALESITPPIAEIDRMPSGDPLNFPALHIHDHGQQRTESEAQMERYVLDLTLEGFVEAAGGTEAHEQLNELQAATIRALFGDYNAGPFAGLAEDVSEGDLRVFIAKLASTRRLAFAQDFTITFSAQRGDPDEQ